MFWRKFTARNSGQGLPTQDREITAFVRLITQNQGIVESAPQWTDSPT
jgi:hypothetical protein